jgi:hypothetical protein
MPEVLKMPRKVQSKTNYVVLPLAGLRSRLDSLSAAEQSARPKAGAGGAG